MSCVLDSTYVSLSRFIDTDVSRGHPSLDLRYPPTRLRVLLNPSGVTHICWSRPVLIVSGWNLSAGTVYSRDVYFEIQRRSMAMRDACRRGNERHNAVVTPRCCWCALALMMGRVSYPLSASAWQEWSVVLVHPNARVLTCLGQSLVLHQNNLFSG